VFDGSEERRDDREAESFRGTIFPESGTRPGAGLSVILHPFCGERRFDFRAP
jgi:hypothetical protein